MLREKRNACESSSELVSYMYGELARADAERFETHLADCMTCIDEFAAVSNSRYSVYEWRKLEFDPLETPVFEVPYEERPRQIVLGKAGWFDAVWGILAIARSPIFAVAAAVVVIALGFGAYVLVRNAKPEVAEIPTFEQPVTPAAPVIAETRVETTKPMPAAPEPTEARTIKASTTVRHNALPLPRYAVERVRTIEKVPGPSRLAKKAPKLGDLAEDEEETLRLADLVGEIGG